MRIVYFTHSLTSCWNHGNAHFLRGLLRELGAAGHDVTACQPANGWSEQNLVADHGEAPLLRFRRDFPELRTRTYDTVEAACRTMHGADLVIVHEWTEPDIVAAIGAQRQRGHFILLFHDTHHRAVSDPTVLRHMDLSDYDGVLAFGESLAEVYRRAGWGQRAYVFHEAADTRLFRPLEAEAGRDGLVWIGNWGDDERTEELVEFLLAPAQASDLHLDIHGVRYPQTAREVLARHGARYHGWIANVDVPGAFAKHLATVHVPRRYYASLLPGIPTIRVFEALACGIPLVCAPWTDIEGLFTPGRDYLVAANGPQMTAALCAVANGADLRASLIASGLCAIRARHTCRHRAEQLLAIACTLRPELAGAA
jgi:spore maturation protein CgeB